MTHVANEYFGYCLTKGVRWQCLWTLGVALVALSLEYVFVWGINLHAKNDAVIITLSMFVLCHFLTIFFWMFPARLTLVRAKLRESRDDEYRIL